MILPHESYMGAGKASAKVKTRNNKVRVFTQNAMDLIAYQTVYTFSHTQGSRSSPYCISTSVDILLQVTSLTKPRKEESFVSFLHYPLSECFSFSAPRTRAIKNQEVLGVGLLR